MTRAIAAFAFVAACLSPAVATAGSAYTSLDTSACVVLDEAPPGGPGAWRARRCEGLPGYPVFVSDDDGRMSLDYGPVEERGRWESFASFNRVHDTVEWRLDVGGEPFATIHRWFVSAGDGTERQVLVVSTVASEAIPRSCVVGIVDVAAGASPNARARGVADESAQAFRCGLDEAGYVGPVGPERPQFAPAAAEPRPRAMPATPRALVQAYWSALEAAARPEDLARYRLDGAPPAPLFARLTELVARYQVASVQPLVAADAERRLAVVLRPRDGEAASPLSAELGVVRLEDGWRIADEDW